MPNAEKMFEYLNRETMVTDAALLANVCKILNQMILEYQIVIRNNKTKTPNPGTLSQLRFQGVHKNVNGGTVF